MKVVVHHARFGADIAAALSRAHPDVDVTLHSDEGSAPPDVEQAEVVIGMRFPAGMLARARALRWLQVTGAGADHVADLSRDVVVTHAGSVPARAVAEHVCMAALCLPWREEEERGRPLHALPPRRRSLHGAHMVIAGLGSIGTAVARRGLALGVRVTAVTRTPRPVDERALPEVDVVCGREGLLAAAARADVLVLAVPRTPGTVGLVDEEVIEALPAAAVVINVARADVVDVAALVSALRSGRIAGALLDVHHEEPLPPSSSLWEVPNLWLTPHSAYLYQDHPADVAALCVENLGRYRRGAPLLNVSGGAGKGTGREPVGG